MRARGFWRAEICVTNFSCPTKTLLAHFRKSAFGLSDKSLDLATSLSFKICLYFLMVCTSILGGAALYVCVIILLCNCFLVCLCSC